MSEAPQRIWAWPEGMPIYCSGTNPTQRQAVQYLHADHVDALVAAADALARHASAQLAYMDLCNDKGDFERNLRAALAAYNEAKKGHTE